MSGEEDHWKAELDVRDLVRESGDGERGRESTWIPLCVQRLLLFLAGCAKRSVVPVVGALFFTFCCGFHVIRTESLPAALQASEVSPISEALLG